MAPAAIVDKDFEPEVTDEVALFTMNVAHANEARSSSKVHFSSTTIDSIGGGSLTMVEKRLLGTSVERGKNFVRTTQY